MIVVVPADTPVTKPVEVIVATVVILLLQVPPKVASLSVIVEPLHRFELPLMAAGVR